MKKLHALSMVASQEKNQGGLTKKMALLCLYKDIRNWILKAIKDSKVDNIIQLDTIISGILGLFKKNDKEINPQTEIAPIIMALMKAEVRWQSPILNRIITEHTSSIMGLFKIKIMLGGKDSKEEYDLNADTDVDTDEEDNCGSPPKVTS